MTFALGFICGVVLGGVVTHLAHEYLDAMLEYKRDDDPADQPLWLRSKDEEKDK